MASTFKTLSAEAAAVSSFVLCHLGERFRFDRPEHPTLGLPRCSFLVPRPLQEIYQPVQPAQAHPSLLSLVPPI